MKPQEITKDVRQIRTMLEDLRTIQTKYAPDALEGNEGSNRGSVVRSLDEYQHKKQELSAILKNLRDLAKHLQDARKHAGENRTVDIIRTERDLHTQAKQATAIWEEMQKFVVKEERKKKQKLDPQELEARKQETELLGQEIRDLVKKSSRVQVVMSGDEIEMAERQRSRAEQRRLDREERLRQRKETRRNKRGKVAPDQPEELQGLTIADEGPISAQEQAFLDQVDANRDEQNEILDQISKSLAELAECGKDIGRSLDVQAAMINEVDQKMDRVDRKLAKGNVELSRLLEASGGATRWCPVIVCLLLLLALVGYILQLVL